MKGLTEGFFPRHFYDEVGNEMDGTQGHGVVVRDPHKHFTDHFDTAPEDFNRSVDLDG